MILFRNSKMRIVALRLGLIFVLLLVIGEVLRAQIIELYSIGGKIVLPVQDRAVNVKTSSAIFQVEPGHKLTLRDEEQGYWLLLTPDVPSSREKVARVKVESVEARVLRPYKIQVRKSLSIKEGAGEILKLDGKKFSVYVDSIKSARLPSAKREGCCSTCWTAVVCSSHVTTICGKSSTCNAYDPQYKLLPGKSKAQS